jgi:hypothetical protein
MFYVAKKKKNKDEDEEKKKKIFKSLFHYSIDSHEVREILTLMDL